MSHEARTKAQAWFPIIAIVCVLLLALGAGGVYVRRTAIPEAHRSVSASHLRMIGQGMAMYAAGNGRQYPEHAGRLLAGYTPAQVFSDPRRDSPLALPYTPGDPRPAPVYRFGDVIFLYDPTAESGKLANHIVAVSVTDFDPEWRNVAMADGSVIRVNAASFGSAILGPDNAARKAAGLPEIDIKDIEALDNPAGS